MEEQSLNSVPMPTAPNTYRQLSSVSSLLRTTGNFYQRHFSKLLSLIVIILAGNLLPLLARIFDEKSTAFTLGTTILSIIGVLVGLVGSIAMMVYVAQDGATDFKGALVSGNRLLIPYIWAGFLVGLVTLGGFLLFIIPGIIMSVMLTLTAYSVVAENKRGLDALIQSWHYVKGHGMAVFGRMLAMGLILLVLIMIVGAVTGLSVASPNSINSDPTHRNESVLQAVLVNAVVAFTEPLSFIYLFSIFRELREIKGEISPEDRKSKKTVLIWFIVAGIFAIILMTTLLVVLGVASSASHKLPGTVKGIMKTIY
jgi:hypothetical protein